MSLIQADRQATAQNLSAMSLGTYFSLAGLDYVRADVAGRTPAAGHSFALRLADGRVCQLAEGRPDLQYEGALFFVAYAGTATGATISAVTTLADVPVGKFFDTSVPGTPGVLGMRVEVRDENGVPIQPDAGNAWIVVFSAGVSQVALTTPVESYGDAGATAYKVQ